MTFVGAANVEVVVEERLYARGEEVVALTVQNVAEVMLHTGRIPRAHLPLCWIFHLQWGRRSDKDHTHHRPGQLNPHTGPLAAELAGVGLGGYLTIGGEAVAVELEGVVEQPGELRWVELEVYQAVDYGAFAH